MVHEERLTAEQAKQDAFIKDAVQKAVNQRFSIARKAEEAAKSASGDVLAHMRTTVAPQTSATSCGVADPLPVTVVINKKQCLNPITYAPKDLVAVDGRLLRADAAKAIVAMQAGSAAANAPFTVFSGYRSYSDQVITYNAIVVANGAAIADTLSARPGYSEHQTGLAADLKVGACTLDCFETTPAYAWLIQHAADYGFIQRYAKDLTPITGYGTEAWHWRYVGKKTALDMRAKGLQTLEEYFNIDGGNYS